MKPPPAPLPPSGLSDACRDIVGTPLVLRCSPGWGWQHRVRGESMNFDDETLLRGTVHLMPEGFVEFTTPRSGIHGTVILAPDGYAFRRFVAFTKIPGCDHDFADHITQSWRVILGDGELDCDSAWFPLLSGEDVYLGYGAIGLNEEVLDIRRATEERAK